MFPSGLLVAVLVVFALVVCPSSVYRLLSLSRRNLLVALGFRMLVLPVVVEEFSGFCLSPWCFRVPLVFVFQIPGPGLVLPPLGMLSTVCRPDTLVLLLGCLCLPRDSRPRLLGGDIRILCCKILSFFR